MTTSPKASAVATLEQLPPGSQLEVSFDNKAVLLCHSESGIYAVDALCSHMQKPLFGGKQQGTTLFCPYHAAKFNLATGEALALPAFKALNTYQVTLLDEQIYLSTTKMSA